MDAIRIYNTSGILHKSISKVLSSSFSESLDGVMSFRFATEAKRIYGTKKGFTVEFRGQYYRIVRLGKDNSGGLMVYTADCEHISYILNDDDYAFESFEFSGTPSAALQQVLSGTSLSVGVVEKTQQISINFKNKINRRKVLMQIVALSGGEIEYDGYKINIRSHRGNTSRKLVGSADQRMADINEQSDLRSNTTSQNLSFWLNSGFKVGDEIKINFDPLEIYSDTRIISVEYDPFYSLKFNAVVGDYIPEILDMYSETEDQLKDYDNRLSDAEASLDDIAEDYQKKSDVNATIDTYINSQAGTASIQLACTGKFATVDDIRGFQSETEVRTIISSEINQIGGSIKLYVEGKNYLTETTAAGTFVKSTELSAGIKSYVNTSDGTASIVSAVSGTYQTKEDMSGYATTTQVTNTISQTISPLETTIKLVVGAGKLVGTGGTVDASIIVSAVNNASSSIKINADKIEMTGTTTFLTAKDVGTSGTTTISGSRIDTSTLYLDTLYANGRLAIRGIGYDIWIGGTTSSNSFNIVYLLADNYIRFGSWRYSSGNGIDMTFSSGGGIMPVSNNGANLGSSSYKWNNAYITTLYLNGKKLEDPGTPLKDTDIKRLYSSTSSYVEYNLSQQLVPNSSYAYLGSSSSKWNTGYITSLYVTSLYINNTLFTPISATDVKRLYYSASYYVEYNSSQQLISNYSSASLGSSSSKWNTGYITSLYVTSLYINNTLVTPISDTDVKKLYANSSYSSYYVEYNSSYQLVASYSSSSIGSASNKWSTGYITTLESTTVKATTLNADSVLPGTGYGSKYLGGSSNYWGYAYIGSTQSVIGNTSSSRVGFFGSTGTTRQSLTKPSSSDTLANLITKVTALYTALTAYGLISS